MKNKKYNFSYEFIRNNPDSEEARRAKFVENNILNTGQDHLVNLLFEKEIFSYDDIQNLYPNNSEEIQEIQEKINLMHSDPITNEKAIEKLEEEKEQLEAEEQEPNEVYVWVSANLGEYDKVKLDKANYPYISNEYGDWIGRTDFGSAWDLYFIPGLANALYNNN